MIFDYANALILAGSIGVVIGLGVVTWVALASLDRIDAASAEADARGFRWAMGADPLDDDADDWEDVDDPARETECGDVG